MRVPFFVPDMDGAEKAALAEVIDSGWISMGPRVRELEDRFANLIGREFAVAVSSCTAALHLAAITLDLGPGDEVIVPSFTFVSTANAVHFTGATPVFADIKGPDDWTLDPTDVAGKVTERTRAVVAMHYAGYPCDMEGLDAVCRAHGLTLLEDACHGLGGSLGGRAMGALSKGGCFSFYSNKVITTAEGGMLTTDDESIATRARRLRAHGMTRTSLDAARGTMGYDVLEVGYNYRLDELRAAMGLVQLDRLPRAIERRRILVDAYRARLADIRGVSCPRHGERGEPACYLLPVLLESADRDALRKRLLTAGVETSMHYPPVHRFMHYRALTPADLPVTDWVAARAVTLPLYPSMSHEQVDYVCDSLVQAVRES
ncbi:DegT/DnrJ/EryC1/StrS family aminotransferase [Planctomycetota bacterium]